jgi:predicted N-acetyltransferase YhbS
VGTGQGLLRSCRACYRTAAVVPAAALQVDFAFAAWHDGAMPAAPPDVHIIDLCLVPDHRMAAARMVHAEFWTHVPGASAERMAARMAQADRPGGVPQCLVALAGDAVVGVVNLVHSDDDDHPEWHPWLAGLVVAPDWRGRGVGSALVRAVLTRARALPVRRVYFGTDGPGFYTRLGAVVQLQRRADFWYMRFDLPAPGAQEGGS